VVEQVGERKAVPSFAGLFALNLAFGRRLAFASLLTLSPEAVMAQEDSPAFDSASAQDNMLVTLTAYEY
jgi:hypothetical protein